ncbi:MAG: glutamine synthetase family protein [Thermodesulfovibrionales bacterium]|nr:glutamine synthetase family protein [Thermodesulfovibrionales bacterium]MDP3111038.1 glutamine synthetase family protein [Thermodesulfovibrionales bacterium]
MKTIKVLEKAKRDKVIFINLQFTDMLGCLKEVTAPVQSLPDIMKYGAWFDGSSVEGFARIHESDLYLKPDPSTYSVIPWLNSQDGNTARLICDIYSPDGSPFEGDPRFILKNALKKASEMGFEYDVGPELEFFLFRNGQDKLMPLDNSGYFDLATDESHNIMREITSALETFGIDVEASHHEVAPGQYEIDFKYGEALTTADRLLTLRVTVKAIAQKHGLKASFMPKPVMGMAGSGMHVHQSLFSLKTKKNAFYNFKDKYKLSKAAYNFIAGQLRNIKGMAAVLCPTVNSYKRLVTGFEAPVYISWARINRSALIRVPHWFEDKPNSARIELRCPDPACNPYLAFAVMLAAGLNGIEKNMKLTEPVEEDLYKFDEEKLASRKIDTLPSSLYEAVNELRKNDFIQGVLGKHLYQKYMRIKTREWNEFKMQVTEWELEKYLDI